MSVLKNHKKTYIYLIALTIFFAAYFICRNQKQWMEILVDRVLLPFEQQLGSLTSTVPFSVSEALYLFLIALTGALLIRMIVRLILKPEKGRTLYGFFLYLVCMAASIYAAFCLFWGTMYGLDGFCSQANMKAEGGTKEELLEVTTLFLEETNKVATKIVRDENGLFAQDQEEIFAVSGEVYQGLFEEYPFLEKPTTQPKPFFFSKALSYLDFTGYYFPMTGEANINVDSPAYHLPMTICHESAHQSGITSEKECNFIGILAATKAKDVSYQYSGYLCGFVYLANALYKEDEEACIRLYAQLDENARKDLQYNSEYWRQFTGPIQKASNVVYDGFLKSNGDSKGIQSYGLVVDLLLEYYKKAA